MKIIFILAALALPVHAAEVPSSQLIKDMEGVYKDRFPNRVVPGKPGEKYEAEDQIEVVRHDDEHIYLRASVSFDNGQRCGFQGIAGYEKGVFVYHDPNPTLSDKQSCIVNISSKGEQLVLTDRGTPQGPSSCKTLCGARGGLGTYTIAMSKKSKINYLPKLKATKEYQKAVQAFTEAQR